MSVNWQKNLVLQEHILRKTEIQRFLCFLSKVQNLTIILAIKLIWWTCLTVFSKRSAHRTEQDHLTKQRFSNSPNWDVNTIFPGRIIAWKTSCDFWVQPSWVAALLATDCWVSTWPTSKPIHTPVPTALSPRGRLWTLMIYCSNFSLQEHIKVERASWKRSRLNDPEPAWRES